MHLLGGCNFIGRCNRNERRLGFKIGMDLLGRWYNRNERLLDSESVRAKANNVIGPHCRRLVERLAVKQGAVDRLQILDEKLVALPAQPGVVAGDAGIVEVKVGGCGAANEQPARRNGHNFDGIGAIV
jgi:hypothetical protein